MMENFRRFFFLTVMQVFLFPKDFKVSPKPPPFFARAIMMTCHLAAAKRGEQLQKLKVGVEVELVSFSSKGPFLETDRGLLKVECYTPLVSPQTDSITEIFVTEQ